MPLKTDEEIVAQVQSGDNESFGILVERYEEKMKRYVRRFLFGYEESQDVVQDVFLKAYTHIQSFDTKQKFSSWLYRIAHNESLNAIKKKGKEPLPFFDPDVLFPHPVAKENIEDDLHKKQMREMLDACLSQIDVKYREVLVLYYFEEMNYKEISEIMRIPGSTVGVRLKRGKKFLKSVYTKRNEAYEN